MNCLLRAILNSRQPAQFIEEVRVGDSGAIGALDQGFAFGGEGGYGEGHGDAVIAARFDFRAVDFAGVAALDAQTIGKLLHFCAHFAEVFGKRGDAVAFLDAQLGGVANLDALFGEGTESGEHGQFVNQERNEVAGNVATIERGAFDNQVADDFALRALQIQDGERGAHGLKEIENGGTRGIQADIGDEEIGFGEQRCGGDEENGRGKIAGDIEGLRSQGDFAGAVDRALDGDGAAALGDLRAEKFKGQLGVIARGGGFGDERFAFGEEAGEENGGFHLGAGHGHFVLNAMEMAAADFERGEIAFASLNLRAHLKEWGNDSLHGTLLERGIAGNSGGEVLAGEDAGEETDGGAGVFGVEGAPTTFQAAQAAAGDLDGGAFDFYFRAQGFHAAEGAVAIAGGGEMAEFAGAIGECGEHSVAMRDGFVAGKFQAAGEGAGGMDGDVFHDDGSWRKFSTRGFGGWEGRGNSKKNKESITQRHRVRRGRERRGECLYWGTVLLGNAGGNGRKQFVGGVRIMEENKLRIALEFGEAMLARRTLLQLVTKLAIGVGALFLVGVLLAAIPNHRAPVVEGASAQAKVDAQAANPATVPTKVDAHQSRLNDATGGGVRRHAAAPKKAIQH